MEAKRVEEILNSLNGIRRAEASSYLYSKLRNRLQVAEPALPPRLAWRLTAALLIVAVLNIVTIRVLSNEPQVMNSGAEGVANEYSISLPQTY